MERKVLGTLRSMRLLWLALKDPNNWRRSRLWYRGGRALPRDQLREVPPGLPS